MRFMASRLALGMLMAWGASVIAQPATAPASESSAKLVSPAASAKSVSPIQTQFKAYKLYFLASGKEELEPASSVSPGDVVEYVAVHRNVSQRRLLNVDFAIPIPYGTTLWQGSVNPADGLLKASDQLASDAKTESPSKALPRVVWRVDRLDPGQSVKLKLRVSIDADPSIAPAPAANPFRPSQPQLRKP